MRIALAQINPTVGDIEGNAKIIGQSLSQALESGVELVVFPELALIGYPPKDLLLKPAVLDACHQALEELADQCQGIAAIIGYPQRTYGERGRTLHNAAALCMDGQIVHRHAKSLLPTYDVFDESRYFEPGPRVDLTQMGDVQLGISVCEDLWNDREMFSRQLYHDNPIDALAALGAQVFINASASPFVVRKHSFRLKLMSHVAHKHRIPLVYCNQVGGNDELVFDGNSCVIDADGSVVAHAKAFEEDLLIVNLDLDKQALEQNTVQYTSHDMSPYLLDPLDEAYRALVLGVRDYCRKCGFKSAVLGLSGGIDSALTAVVAADALGAENVTGVTMPSRYSSSGSRSDAQILAENLGMKFHELPIEGPHGAFEKLLEPMFAGTKPSEAEENVQARSRGVLLMAISNKFGSILLTTGNKSEMAVGYCTLYGDMAGGLALLSDVPKTMVYDLSKFVNDRDSPVFARFGKVVIPADTITKPPSAELRPDQKDQDSLPPYEVLDDIVERYVEREQPVGQILDQTGYDQATVHKVVKLIDRNEYKRKQAPPGLKITGRAFGFGRRMPIAQRWDATGQ